MALKTVGKPSMPFLIAESWKRIASMLEIQHTQLPGSICKKSMQAGSVQRTMLDELRSCTGTGFVRSKLWHQSLTLPKAAAPDLAFLLAWLLLVVLQSRHSQIW